VGHRALGRIHGCDKPSQTEESDVQNANPELSEATSTRYYGDWQNASDISIKKSILSLLTSSLRQDQSEAITGKGKLTLRATIQEEEEHGKRKRK
jgi:hypothetical protein